MVDLTVRYLGIPLRSPIVVSSSSLTGTVQGVKKCADSGAGAVVLKSLFEEQIEAEMKQPGVAETQHPEADDYFETMGKYIGPSDYLKLIEETKNSVSIPVFASLNCVSDSWWSRYAEQIEKAGADGIELNIALMPRDAEETAEQAESRFIEIVRKVRAATKLPIAVKIGPYFTALPHMAEKIKKAGASGLVLFNRFYQMDIDVDSLKLKPGYQFSSPVELYTSLRWISILSGQIEDCDFSASTGVHDGKSVIKQILAGATTVQVCSALFQKGVGEIRTMLNEMEAWMNDHGFISITDFRGKLTQIGSEEPETYERLQYVKALTGIG